MMEFVTALENISCKFDRIVALLDIYDRIYNDVSDQEAQRLACDDRDTMVNMHHAIHELSTKYSKDAAALAREYHSKVKESKL